VSTGHGLVSNSPCKLLLHSVHHGCEHVIRHLHVHTTSTAGAATTSTFTVANTVTHPVLHGAHPTRRSGQPWHRRCTRLCRARRSTPTLPHRAVGQDAGRARWTTPFQHGACVRARPLVWLPDRARRSRRASWRGGVVLSNTVAIATARRGAVVVKQTGLEAFKQQEQLL